LMPVGLGLYFPAKKKNIIGSLQTIIAVNMEFIVSYSLHKLLNYKYMNCFFSVSVILEKYIHFQR
jgi:hypothetical protein